MKIQSTALEANIATYHVEVAIDPKYRPIEEVMARYFGLMEGVHVFLKELSHPYRNWQFIVKEARGYALDYFHLFNSHPKGPLAAELFFDIFLSTLASCGEKDVKVDAADNLILFLSKIIRDAGCGLSRFLPALNAAFDRIRELSDADFFLFVKSFYPLKRLGDGLSARCRESSIDLGPINALLIDAYRRTYDYWLAEEDPRRWFEADSDDLPDDVTLNEIFSPVSHQHLNQMQDHLTEIANACPQDSELILSCLNALDGYHQIVESYRDIPQKLLDAGRQSGHGNRWKVIFLFHIMNVSGLSAIHEESLRDINRTLTWLIVHESHRNIRSLIEKTFSILSTRTRRFPATALSCVLNMGKGVYQTDESDLVNFFIDSVIDLGFQLPMIAGVGNDWQIKVNSAHIQNVRTWLELIELNPKWSTRLLSALVIHLALCGVFIKDTDLFPRDITRFLNSHIGPVYNLAKQLARLFPVYFNDIGAEGQLRDISTKIDEITRRKDVLIHFLRKQSHVESSSQIVGFMAAALNFWKTRDKQPLRSYVPPDIFDQIESSGPYIDGVFKVIGALEAKEVDFPDGLVTLEETRRKRMLEAISAGEPQDRERVDLAITFFRLLNQKYNLDFLQMDHSLASLRNEAFPNLDDLKAAVEEKDLKKKIGLLLDYLDVLKKLILSEKVFEIREDIYKKRHFTVDIPSMYGSYHEMKFDALGLTFRIESLVNTLFEQLVKNIDLSLITKATFYQIYSRLKLFYRALKIDGISSVEIERQLDFLSHSLDVRGFTFTQYLDIFKGFAQAVKNIINDYFHNIHEQTLTRILPKIPEAQIQEKFLPREGLEDREKFQHRVSEIFFRDRISLSLGLQQLDLFLSRILTTLFHQSFKLPKDKLHLLLNYDPQRAMTVLDPKAQHVTGIIYLGNKGYNMVQLKSFDLPVPPGFIITTEAFRCREIIDGYPPAQENFREQVAHQISITEKMTGKSFGDPTNPLLFSVRSGSSISQPGMMDTFLDVGINETIAAGLAVRTGNSWFAWDNYRRFLQCFGMSFGLERDDFDAIMSDHKQRLGIPYKKGFTGEQMRQLALSYRQRVLDAGIELVDDPLEQLHMTIKRVFGSWDSSKARTYRKIMGISDDWGTAVTVQAMVYGNLSNQSGTGVFFTHNPRWSGDILKLWGDFTIENQGEDVVSGLVKTLPISKIQRTIEKRDTDITLETHFPQIYGALKEWANELIYKRAWSPQEMEFTFEGPIVQDLYLLQTRDMTIRERKQELTFDLEGIPEARFLGHGIGVSGGALSGRIVFGLDEIDRWRSVEPDTPLVLFRSDTVPDDIREIYASDGLLTARGGLTSHAAVVAHRLGKTCVVSCGNMVCNERDRTCTINQVFLKAGDHISIDGKEGSVYQGRLKVKTA